MLLGEQHSARGLERWRQARGYLGWTQSVDDCVRWVAGRGCDQNDIWSAPVVCGLGGTEPPAAEDGPDDMMAIMSEGLVLVTAGAQEGEALLEAIMGQAAAIDAAVLEMGTWAPLLFDTHVEHRARSTGRSRAREARWRADRLVEMAWATEEKLEAAAAEVRTAARSAEHVQAQMAAAMVEVWKTKPADVDAGEEVLAYDFLVLVVATLATALGEMAARASKVLDRATHQVLGGRRRLQQAERVECSAEALWQTWLDEEHLWWSVLAAAVAAADEEAGQPQPADAGDGGRGGGGGGGDGAGPAEGGDDTPSVGQRHADRRNHHDDNDSGSGGRDGTDGGGGRDGGGDDTPPSRRAERSAGAWHGDGVRSWARRMGHGAGKEKVHGEDREGELGGVEERRSAGRGARRMRQLGWRRWLAQRVLGPAARGCCTTDRPREGKLHPRSGGAVATGGTSVLPPPPRWSGAGRRRRMEGERQLILFCTHHHTRGYGGRFLFGVFRGLCLRVCVGGDGSFDHNLVQ